MKEDTPARKAMVYYFCKDLPGRLGNRTTIASVLSNECKISTGMTINNLNEYARMVDIAHDRTQSRQLVDTIVSDQCNIYESKVLHKTELRHAAKRKREEAAILVYASYRVILVDMSFNIAFVFALMYDLKFGVMIGELVIL